MPTNTDVVARLLEVTFLEALEFCKEVQGDFVSPLSQRYVIATTLKEYLKRHPHSKPGPKDILALIAELDLGKPHYIKSSTRTDAQHTAKNVPGKTQIEPTQCVEREARQYKANCYTDLPNERYRGERNLAKQIASFNDSQLHLWFGVDFVPGVRDIDVLLWHEGAGIFVVEVKAVSIGAIESFGWEKYKIQGRPEDYPPNRQARTAMYSLRNLLSSQMSYRRVPFLVYTVCWPLISRDRWNRYWDDKRVVGEYAEKMIFEEDFTSGSSAFVQRLRYIWTHPFDKEKASRPYRHDTKVLEDVRTILSVSAKRRPAPSDLDKLHIIEKRVTRETKDDAPPNSGKRVLYYGYPGTGKTFRLLQIGVHHALSGCKVLFACYNKVLAADIRRLFSYSEELRLAQGEVVIQDVFAIASEYNTDPLRKQDDDYDRWGQLVLDDLKIIAPDLPKYDTVLIDEAQDMKDWALEMIELLSSPNAVVCVAAGSGQELYGGASQWLKRFAETAKQKRLNRNFRNTAPVGRLAHVFYEANFDISKIERIARDKFPARVNKHEKQMLLFERLEGQYPNLINIDEPVSDKSEDGSIPAEHFNALVDEYKRIIKDQLSRLSSDERPLDLLILVPRFNSLERRCAYKALEQLRVRFIDYTEEVHRRDIAQPEMVRLCTFPSARGIEGRRVIIFGIEHLQSLTQEVGMSISNLGYIVLSRSVFECAVGVRPTIESKELIFVERALKVLRKI